MVYEEYVKKAIHLGRTYEELPARIQSVFSRWVFLCGFWAFIRGGKAQALS
jgi:hypothetical protein